jgi:hypothetical protein
MQLRYSLNLQCFPSAYAVELVEKQIAKQRARGEDDEASLLWKNCSMCLALLLRKVSCLMLLPNPYLQMSDALFRLATDVSLHHLPIIPFWK